MKEEVKTEELKEAAREVRRQLEREQERIAEEAQRLEQQLRTLDATEDLLAEIDRLKDEGEGLRSQLQEEKERSTRLEMLLNEMGKMTASVAGKASQEEVLKALRVFVNKSKRKKMEKRIAVKEMVLELANANGLMLPEELAASIDSLDDEQPPEPQPSEVPEVLARSKYWQRVKSAGLVDENNQPTVSRPEAALMAEALAKRIGIDNKWKVFELLWQRNNMRNDYNTALEQKKSLEFQERLKVVLD